MLEIAIDILTNMSAAFLLGSFWYIIVFEMPRYGLSSLIIVGNTLFRRRAPLVDPRTFGTISVLLPGHNEGGSVTRAVDSLNEQTFTDFEIVCVSDGSTDDMPNEIRALERAGKIDRAVVLDLRGGKAAAVNLASNVSHGDIQIVLDCDSSLDRDAMEQILQPFTDPKVGVVSGSILVRNTHESHVAAYQGVEYLITVAMGKQVLDAFDQGHCASGAFSAFRRTAKEEVWGLDGANGEDFDLTIRMRMAGWKVRFAELALCLTDAPTKLAQLRNQRRRWEGDAVDIRYRKFGCLINPFDSRFKASELFHQLDFFFFNMVASFATPVYLAWLVVEFGIFAPLFLTLSLLATMMLDLLVFVLANCSTERHRGWHLWPYALTYGAFQFLIMRPHRAWTYINEFITRPTKKDAFQPTRVRAQRSW